MATIGAYAVERDYSHYVAYASKTILAVVGTATKGPIGEATVVTSSQDLVNKFGPLKTDCYGLYAGQYFLSQASKMYFVRAASNSAAVATATIVGQDSDDNPVSDSIVFEMKEKGTFGNGYTINVKVTTGTESTTYDISLISAKGSTVESYKGITFDKISEIKSNLMKFKSSNTATSVLTAGDYAFSGGNDGIEGITAGDYNTAAEALLLDTIDINLISVPGVSDREVVTTVLGYAEQRGDCLYLVDPPKDLGTSGDTSISNWVNATKAYAGNTKLNSSYGAVYYDWVNIYDSINKTTVQVPPSVVVAASYAYSDRISDLWYAPAGLTRGLVRGVLGPVSNISKSEVEALYDDNINCIYENPQIGLVLWGQKTLFRENTALDRVNVRRLMNYLKKVVTAACDYLVFEPNDRVTWNSFEMKVMPILTSIKNRRGIYEFKILKGETIVSEEDIDNYRMPCMILVRPTKAAEEIPIYFVITSTGADFNEVLEANGIVSE